MPKYIKNDVELGYVEDHAEIEYLKFNNMRHTILGCMLGDCDEEGRYVVDPEIVRELISIRKYVVETLDNIEICVSELKLDKQISFAVTLEGNRATLALLEKVNYEGNFKFNSGSYSNINEYILDEVETSGVVDKNILYRRWNISINGGSVLDVFNMDEDTLAQYFGLVNRFKYLMKANQILLEKESQIEVIETNYIIDTLDLIARYPNLNQEVNKRLKQELNDKKNIICIDKPNFAKTLNELVTQVIDSNIVALSEEERKDYDTEKHNINNNYDIKIRDAVETKTIVVSGKGEEYSKFILNTHDSERYETVTEVAMASVRAQKEAIARARAEAVALITARRKIDILKGLYDYTPREFIGEYFRRNVGHDLNANVAIPVVVVDTAVADDQTKAEVSKAPTKDSAGSGSTDKPKAKLVAKAAKKKNNGKKKSSSNTKAAAKTLTKNTSQSSIERQQVIPAAGRSEEEINKTPGKLPDSHKQGPAKRVAMGLTSVDEANDAFGEEAAKKKVNGASSRVTSVVSRRTTVKAKGGRLEVDAVEEIITSN